MDKILNQETKETTGKDKQVLNDLRQDYENFRIKNQEFIHELEKSEAIVGLGKSPSYTQGTKHEILRPQHYGGENNTYEAIKVIKAWQLGFDLGNVAKYISRAGKKEGTPELQDLEKAATYLSFRINELKGISTDN